MVFWIYLHWLSIGAILIAAKEGYKDIELGAPKNERSGVAAPERFI